jgi:Uncharacterized protein conserved in bacteria (DUF2252)
MTAKTESTVRERAGTRERPTHADRVALGKDARDLAPLESHAEFTPDRSRDPVGLLLEQAKSRVPELVPIRHGRMLVSPFTYYRGAALPMTPVLATGSPWPPTSAALPSSTKRSLPSPKATPIRTNVTTPRSRPP